MPRKHLALLCLLLASALAAGQNPVPENTQNWPARSPIAGVLGGGHTLHCTDSAVPDFEAVAPGHESYTHRICSSIDLFSSSPGFSLGNSFKGSPNGWQLFMGQTLNMRVYGAGIKGPGTWRIFCLGVGDCNDDHEMTTIGGRTATSDEGTEGSRLAVMEPPYTYSGTITSAGRVGERLIHTACPPLKPASPVACDSQGVGRYLIEEATVYSGAATAVTNVDGFRPGTLTVKPALPASMLSTAIGVLTSPCLVTQTAQDAGTACEFNVRVVSGEFRKNYLVAATGTYHNQAELTAVEGSGTTRRLSMVAHHSIPEGAYLYQGQLYGSPTPSCTGTAVELLANTVDKLKYPLDVVGCTTDSAGNSVLQVVQFLAGFTNGVDLGNVLLGSMGVQENLTSDASGDVTIVPAANPIRYIGQTITIANSRSFSGPCEKLRYSNSGRSVVCHQAGSANRGDSAHDSVAISLGTTGFGNSELVLHRMAEVLDVRNPQTLAVDGSFTLEANEMNTTAGTEVEESHFYSQQLQLHSDLLELHTPYQAEYQVGTMIQFFGHAYGAGDYLPSLAPWRATNWTPLTDYAGLGGVRLPPDLMNGIGLWHSAVHLAHAPDTAGGALEIVGCPATDAGCADPVYTWKPRRFAGYQGEFSEEWNPATDTFRVITGSKRGTSVFAMSPAGFALDKPLHVARGSDPADAATLAQLPLAASLTTTAAASDVLALPGMTSNGHCSLTATNPAAARNLTLTYISEKTVDSITVAHVAVPGMTYDVLCTTY